MLLYSIRSESVKRVLLIGARIWIRFFWRDGSRSGSGFYRGVDLNMNPVVFSGVGLGKLRSMVEAVFFFFINLSEYSYHIEMNLIISVCNIITKGAFEPAQTGLQSLIYDEYGR